MQITVIMTIILITPPVSWWLTGCVYRYALKNEILDHPGDRSLHDQPTPRGGGLSIAAIVLATVFIAGLGAGLPTSLAIGLFTGGMIVAVTGWIDDHKGLPALVRGIAYLVASGWTVSWTLGAAVWSDPAIFTIMIGITLGLTWLTNLYNFMDGSDGFAAIEAISTGMFIAILSIALGETTLAALAYAISASAAGFLFWNWPPARVFMGDVGSCLLGFVLGSLAVYTTVIMLFPVAIWLILLSVFICDSSLTLIMRIFNGEQWYRAHRQHAYQRLVQLGKTHKQLNHYLISVNLLLLYPAACMVWKFQSLQWWISLLVYLLLAGIWLIIQIKYTRQINRMMT